MELAKVSVNRRIDKNVAYTRMAYYSAIKKNEIL
jgi:hypothetical protein